MPELPEVETVRQGLASIVTGRRIERVTVLHPRPVRNHAGGPDDFALTLIGRTFAEPRRRGKYLWLPFTDGDALLAHLGMSGQFRLDAADAALLPNTRVLFDLAPVDRDPGFRHPAGISSSRRTPGSPGAGVAEGVSSSGRTPGSPGVGGAEGVSSSGRMAGFSGVGGAEGVSSSDSQPGSHHAVHQLRFVDQRMFGGLSLSVGGAELPRELAHIGRDPFDPDFDLAAAVRTVRSKRSGIKRVLLDQTVVSGIGNIYADEALWRARLHYDRAANTLSAKQVRDLLTQAQDVMAQALAQGGTSFDSLYVNVNGSSGYFERALAAYGREGLPCLRCGRLIVREAFMNRSSYRCPTCQRRPRRSAR